MSPPVLILCTVAARAPPCPPPLRSHPRSRARWVQTLRSVPCLLTRVCGPPPVSLSTPPHTIRLCVYVCACAGRVKCAAPALWLCMRRHRTGALPCVYVAWMAPARVLLWVYTSIPVWLLWRPPSAACSSCSVKKSMGLMDFARGCARASHVMCRTPVCATASFLSACSSAYARMRVSAWLCVIVLSLDSSVCTLWLCGCARACI